MLGRRVSFSASPFFTSHTADSARERDAVAEEVSVDLTDEGLLFTRTLHLDEVLSDLALYVLGVDDQKDAVSQLELDALAGGIAYHVAGLAQFGSRRVEVQDVKPEFDRGMPVVIRHERQDVGHSGTLQNSLANEVHLLHDASRPALCRDVVGFDPGLSGGSHGHKRPFVSRRM